MDYIRVSDANVITEKYMDSILLEERLIDSVVADISTMFLDEKFDMPVMTPAFSHLKSLKKTVLPECRNSLRKLVRN